MREWETYPQQIISYQKEVGPVTKLELRDMIKNYLEVCDDQATEDILSVIAQFMETKKDILEPKGKELDFYLDIKDELEVIIEKIENR